MILGHEQDVRARLISPLSTKEIQTIVRTIQAEVDDKPIMAEELRAILFMELARHDKSGDNLTVIEHIQKRMWNAVLERFGKKSTAMIYPQSVRGILLAVFYSTTDAREMNSRLFKEAVPPSRVRPLAAFGGKN